MGSWFGNPKDKQTKRSTYTYNSTPVTGPDIADARNAVHQGVNSGAPIVAAFGRNEGLIKNRIFERDLPKGREEDIRTADLIDNQSRKGEALAQAAANDQQTNIGNRITLAQFTKDQLLPGSEYTEGEGWQTGIVNNPWFQML